MISIRNRLIIIIFGTLLVCITAIALFTFRYVQEEFTEVMDGSLKQLAISISSNTSSDERYDLINTKRLEQEGEFIIQIWNSGTLSYTSHPLIKIALQSEAGYGSTSYDYGSLRYYQHIRGDEIVQVLQSFDERQDMLKDMQYYFIMPILLACPVFIILLYIAIGQGLRPLTLLSKKLRERDASNLAAIDIANTAEEIEPITQSLNQLLHKLEGSRLLQQRFTSDAAHELRTPLTAIKLQLDILKRTQDTQERKDIERALDAAIKRSANLVESLLLLARHEADILSIGREKVNLSSISQQVVTNLMALSKQKNQTLTFHHSGENADIDAQFNNIYVVIENLLQNAILYTPESGKIEVSVACGDAVTLTVKDNGIGIQPEERERVFDRFYRCQGTQQIGSGLGLSIVKNIVEYYQGTIQVSDGLEGRGTSFTLEFAKSSL